MTYITTRDDETNYVWHFDGPVDILLDGKRVFGCFEADDEAGYVTKAKRDVNGDIVAIDGEIQTVKLHGKVELIGERRKPSWC